MNDMDDEFDITEAEFDNRFAAATPVDPRGPIVPCGMIVDSSTQTLAPAVTTRQSMTYPTLRAAATAAV